MVSTTPQSHASSSSSSEKKKRKNASQTTNDDVSRNKKPKKRSRNSASIGSASAVLAGMTIAVSTLQNDTTTISSKDNDDIKSNTKSDTATTTADTTTNELSYKSVTDSLRNLGATVSSQVHKKVKCVLCTPAAVQQATQRVRKAQKKNIPLVNVEWLFACVKQEQKLEVKDYILDYPDEKKRDHSKTQNDVESVDAKDVPDPDAGWSEAVNVGCCCACHENGEKDCPWCPDCKV